MKLLKFPGVEPDPNQNSKTRDISPEPVADRVRLQAMAYFTKIYGVNTLAKLQMEYAALLPAASGQERETRLDNIFDDGDMLERQYYLLKAITVTSPGNALKASRDRLMDALPPAVSRCRTRFAELQEEAINGAQNKETVRSAYNQLVSVGNFLRRAQMEPLVWSSKTPYSVSIAEDPVAYPSEAKMMISRTANTVVQFAHDQRKDNLSPAMHELIDDMLQLNLDLITLLMTQEVLAERWLSSPRSTNITAIMDFKAKGGGNSRG